MKRLSRYRVASFASIVFTLLLCARLGLSQTNVITYHYDNARTGQNTLEKFLTPANVNPNQFRRLFLQSVDGQIYSQPLYLSNVSIAGKGTHNVVYVATQGDSVWAFDADDNQGANAVRLWQANLLDPAYGAAPGATTVPQENNPEGISCTDISPQIGITSTPVIDPAKGTLYVVAKSKEVVNGGAHYVQRLHALDVGSGAEKTGSPVIIGDTTIGGPEGGYTNNTAVSVPGTGDGSAGGTLRFNALRQNQRVGLLLQEGTLYIASGSHCDTTPFHGWIIAYDANSLKLSSAFNTTPNASDGGIWMEGAGLAADDQGSIFITTGNGTFDTTLDSKGFPDHRDFGDSFLRLNAQLGVEDYFTPFNQGQMDGADNDLGSGGVLLIPETKGPHRHLLTEAGKLGTVYLVDRDQMTTANQHFCAGCNSDQNIVQELSNGVICTPVPVYWNGTVYFRGDCDVLKAFPLKMVNWVRPSRRPTVTVERRPSPRMPT